jgi:hypothetical protein
MNSNLITIGLLDNFETLASYGISVFTLMNSVKLVIQGEYKKTFLCIGIGLSSYAGVIGLEMLIRMLIKG